MIAAPDMNADELASAGEHRAARHARQRVAIVEVHARTVAVLSFRMHSIRYQFRRGLFIVHPLFQVATSLEPCDCEKVEIKEK